MTCSPPLPTAPLQYAFRVSIPLFKIDQLITACTAHDAAEAVAEEHELGEPAERLGLDVVVTEIGGLPRSFKLRAYCVYVFDVLAPAVEVAAEVAAAFAAASAPGLKEEA